MSFSSENCVCRSSFAVQLRIIVLYVFIVFCFAFFSASFVRGGESARASLDYYPHTLDEQLRRIAESPSYETIPLRDACFSILEDLNAVVAHIEHSPADPCLALFRLETALTDWEETRKNWQVTVSSHQDDPVYVPSATALEEISLALQRHIFIWKSLLKAAAVMPSPMSALYEKSFEDVNRLKKCTLAVEQYFTRSRRIAEYQAGQTWREYLDTPSWVIELEACQQSVVQPIRRVSLSETPVIPLEILKTLVQRANTTICRLESQNLSDEQRAYLNNPIINAWKEELQGWQADVVSPINVLEFIEQYEAHAGMSDMRMLAQYIEQLTTSKTQEYRQLGEDLRMQYSMSNARIFLSNSLLNNHLPDARAESAAFRDYVQSAYTVGRRQTEIEFEVTFIPHPTRILTSLNVGVDLATISRSDASFSTQLFNTGRTLVIAQKTIELTDKGFVTEPSRAQIIAHRMKLVKMNTGFDYMPVFAGLFRRTVLDQYESKAASATTETQRKILRQVRAQVDREVAARLQPLNEKIETLSKLAEEDFDLQISGQESRTEEDWLLTAWGISSKDTLLSSTSAPDTLTGSFADVKVHESLPNMLLGKLDFEGQRATVGEFKAMLAERLGQPDIAKPEENDHVSVTFASYNPITVRFVNGRVELTISIAALRILGKTHRDFQVIVRYKPASDSQGQLVLERDSYISLVNVRDQFLMRAVFGKIFSQNRVLPLVPKMLDSNPQYDYLTTGHCRVEKGWFALALVPKESETAQKPTEIK